MRGTWQTTDGGGSGLGAAVLVLVGAALVVTVAGPVVAAVAELVHIVLIVAAVILGIGATGLAAVIAVRVRRRRLGAPPVVRQVTPAPLKASPSLPAPERPAIGRPEVHVHFHGVSAKDVAAIIARQQD